jgi:hypothetical protein
VLLRDFGPSEIIVTVAFVVVVTLDMVMLLWDFGLCGIFLTAILLLLIFPVIFHENFARMSVVEKPEFL